MSLKPSTFSIGIFTIVAIVVAFATVIYVGSVKLFSREETFLLYFRESVAGLSVGAPVKFRGVPIGTVSEIRLRYNQPPESTAIPVFVKIDVDRVEEDLGIRTGLDNEEEFYVQVKEFGLRGQMQLASLISGQQYIELDYIEETPEEVEFVQEEIVYKEIPTVPSMMAKLGTTSSEVFAKLSLLDVESISDGVVEVLRNFNRHLRTLDVQALQQSFISATTSVESTFTGTEMQETLRQVRRTLQSIETLSTELVNSSGPILESVGQSAQDLSDTLSEMELAMRELRETIEPGSELRLEVNRMLSDLSSSARALRELLEFLERNPNALLSGRESR